MNSFFFFKLWNSYLVLYVLVEINGEFAMK